jgi:hypothetical protein
MLIEGAAYRQPQFATNVLFHAPMGGTSMLALDKVVAGAKIRGLVGPAVVEVVRVEWIGSDALNVVYRSNDGPPRCCYTGKPSRAWN